MSDYSLNNCHPIYDIITLEKEDNNLYPRQHGSFDRNAVLFFTGNGFPWRGSCRAATDEVETQSVCMPVEIPHPPQFARKD